ncbi:MAG: cation:proton antiporter [Rhizobiaceae bacterium]|nr:cation:proton antiporter [Rhizobiaceae bacterium]
MMVVVVDILSWASFIVGGFFLFVGSLGMVRLVDFWARLHAASIIDSAGVGLILLGMMLQGGLSLVTAKLALIVLFLFITGPTASHAVANAAFMSGSRPHDMVEDVTAETPPKKTPSKSKKTKTASAAKAPKAATAAKSSKTTRKKS